MAPNWLVVRPLNVSRQEIWFQTVPMHGMASGTLSAHVSVWAAFADRVESPEHPLLEWMEIDMNMRPGHLLEKSLRIHSEVCRKASRACEALLAIRPAAYMASCIPIV